MSSAVSFEPFGASRCTILTSGTLAPMDSFARELGVPFPVRLEAAHVIDVPRQVLAASLSAGPGGVGLRADFANASTVAFQDELGRVILDVATRTPHGMLVFVTSYAALARLTRRWQATQLWKQLQRAKPLFVEPGGSDATNRSVSFDSIFARYRGESQTVRGALFLGVFRGKASEGTDFEGNLARSVVMVGIPFPNVKDQRVSLKRQYNDIHRNTLGSGSDWYALQAYRALNQALGRGIRNRQDWCALLLVDARHGETKRSAQQPTLNASVSRWLRPHLVHFGARYNDLMTGLQAFFERNFVKSQVSS